MLALAYVLLHAPPTTEIYTLSLHDALPILLRGERCFGLERLGRFDRWQRREAQRSRSGCHLDRRREHRWQLVHGDSASRGVERELVLWRHYAGIVPRALRGPFEGQGDVIVQGDAHVL